MTHHADLTPYSPVDKEKPVTSIIVNNIEYDSHGRPVFSNILQERPYREGEQFTLVHCIDNKPTRSFDIAITSVRPDATRPLRVIYEWTGKGFKAGVAGARSYSDAVIKERQQELQRGNVADPFRMRADAVGLVGAVVTLTVSGFIVGLGASIPATFQELTNVIVSAHEQVISSAAYEYDGRQRLSRMKTYLPSDISREIIKTDFFYADENAAVPYKAEIRSYPEGAVRTIP